jgi:hypothetical protein
VNLYDVEVAERVEAELNGLVERRAREARAQRETEEMWAESVRRFYQNKHHQHARAWYEHHERQLRCHEATFGVLVSHHKAERDRYARILGLVGEYERDDGPPPEAA